MGYKAIGSNIRVTLQSPDGNAVLTFKRGKINEMLQARKEVANEPDDVERTRRMFGLVVDKLISVESMEDDDGPLTVERIKALDLDPIVMNAIIDGHNLVMGYSEKSVDPEKKD